MADAYVLETVRTPRGNAKPSGGLSGLSAVDLLGVLFRALEERTKLDPATEADFPFISRIDGAEPLDAIQRRELSERLRAALDALPPYHRGVVLMREVEGLPVPPPRLQVMIEFLLHL